MPAQKCAKCGRTVYVASGASKEVKCPCGHVFGGSGPSEPDAALPPAARVERRAAEREEKPKPPPPTEPERVPSPPCPTRLPRTRPFSGGGSGKAWKVVGCAVIAGIVALVVLPSLVGEIARKLREDAARDKTETESRTIEKELRDSYQFSAPNVSVAYRKKPLLGSAELELTNQTTHDWKSVYVILNPDVEGNLEELRFSLWEQNGFRSPAEKEKVYADVKVGATLTLPLDKFVHTKTGEKFSDERYSLRKAYVKAVVEHRGQDFEFDCFLAWSASD